MATTLTLKKEVEIRQHFQGETDVFVRVMGGEAHDVLTIDFNDRETNSTIEIFLYRENVQKFIEKLVACKEVKDALVSAITCSAGSDYRTQ